MSGLQAFFLVLYTAMLAIPLLAAWDNRRPIARAIAGIATRRAR